MMETPGPKPSAAHPPAEETPRRDEWKTPVISELPRLSDLTLQSGQIPGDGGTGGGGSTVVP